MRNHQNAPNESNRIPYCQASNTKTKPSDVFDTTGGPGPYKPSFPFLRSLNDIAANWPNKFNAILSRSNVTFLRGAINFNSEQPRQMSA